jgi:Ase1/PRC1/MAP65 family protein
VRVWARAGISDQEQRAFFAEGAGLPHAAKVARVKGMLDSAMQALVQQRRAQIMALWDALKIGDQERSLIRALHEPYTNITEAVLIAHDDEVAKLEKSKEDRQEVLTRVDTYQELLNERDILRDATRHPSRLLDRSTNSFRWRKAEERLQHLELRILPDRSSVHA